MLKKIKSQKTIKEIFSYMNERVKLKLTKSNKKLQTKININIMNYTFFSGRYIKYETNDEGKEISCFNGATLFEGQYKGGKRNGEGIEYSENGNTIFEGEYKEGKRNGKGIEYDENENPIFEGEYKDGKKWNGKLYGYVLKDGNGKIENIENYYNRIYLKFEGEYKNGQRNGKGKEYDKNNNVIFEGEYLNGHKWNGKGCNEKGNIIYEINNGISNGDVKEDIYNDNLLFEGEYLNGKRHGIGKVYDYYYIDHQIYEGKYKEGKRNGNGREYNNEGKLIFEGEYLEGHKRKGKEYINNKDRKSVV